VSGKQIQQFLALHLVEPAIGRGLAIIFIQGGNEADSRVVK
jgi:hypothetical protein